MTSMPTSLARRAICSAPLEWPSRPGLPTRILIRWPIRAEVSSTWRLIVSSCALLVGGAAPSTPVLARAGLHVRDRLDRAAAIFDHLHLRPGALGELLDQALHDHRSLEDVGVLEQVGLIGEHLLDAQAPLLVPGAGEAHRLVPGGQL